MIHADGVVNRVGLFPQSGHKSDQSSGFLSAAVSQNSSKRIDYFQYAREVKKPIGKISCHGI
jgi:hypothetical protein